MADEFTAWVRGVLEVGLTDPDVRLANRMKIIGFLKSQVDARKANPLPDDFISELLNAEVDGQRVPEEYVLGVCNLMLVAGIDTTWSAIGSSLWHLAQHPQRRQRLREAPELSPSAIEELLRAYSPVTMARVVGHDTEFQGCPMRSGDRVLMAFPAANRDPAVFDSPTTCCSTGHRTATLPSAPASTGAPVRTSPASSCASRRRRGWPAFPSLRSRIRSRSRGRADRCGAAPLHGCLLGSGAEPIAKGHRLTRPDARSCTGGRGALVRA